MKTKMNPWLKYEDRIKPDEEHKTPIDAGRRRYCTRTNKFRVKVKTVNLEDEDAMWNGMSVNYSLGRQSMLPSQNFWR